MANEELTRARRKLVAIQRARHRLQQRLDAIDYELDVIQPLVKELEDKAVRGELPEYGKVTE